MQNLSINIETINEIGLFTIYWAFFEKKIFSQYCSFEKIKEFDIGETSIQNCIDTINTIKNICLTRWKPINRQNLINHLNIRRRETSIIYILENFLRNADADNNTQIKSIIYICYRIRNNMFHGLKNLLILEQYYDLFKSLNSFLSLWCQIQINSMN